jgi:5-(aminomethyl)-3-furanmethanol phosphate kinase
MTRGPIVVKVGGSLFDLPDLGPRLMRWIEELAVPDVVLLPGGGATADVIRDLDRQHALGEEKCHWLALRALALNAHFLAGLLPCATVIGNLEEAQAPWQAGRLPVLDGYRFACADEGQPGSLPHSWDVTSDSLAARVAQVAQARELILLKSIDVLPGVDWHEAGRRGCVDRSFAAVVQRNCPFRIRTINFRGRQLQADRPAGAP